MRNSSPLSVTVLNLLLCSIAFTAEPPAIERWDRAVCLVSEVAGADGKPAPVFGSAFVVSADESLVLVTAAHVARDTNAKTRVLHHVGMAFQQTLTINVRLVGGIVIVVR